MSDDPGWDGLDRRDFMVTAIGASAALAANTDPSSAQATAASRGTVYTGDMIGGKKVISALNIDDLEPGKKHLFCFRVDNGREGDATGQAYRTRQWCARR
jgi:uncharacterized protein